MLFRAIALSPIRRFAHSPFRPFASGAQTVTRRVIGVALSFGCATMNIRSL